MITKITISLSLDKQLVQEIDSKRGLASRSAYIGNVLKRDLKEQPSTVAIRNADFDSSESGVIL